MLGHCQEDRPRGNLCVEYQFRMITNPLTVTAALGALAWPLKFRFPMMMMLPYTLGRAVTAVAATKEVQVVVATPLLALGYFWGHLTFSAHKMRDAMYLFGFTALLFALAAVVRELDTLLGRVDIDQDEFLMDFVQIPLCAIAVVLSCISL